MDTPAMNEKLHARMQKGAEELLEPGETVLYGITNLGLPVWAYMGFGGLVALPIIIQRAAMAVVTERNVYVFKTGGLGFKAKHVLVKGPLGTVEARVGGGPFPGRYLLIGDQKLWLHLNGRIQARARAIATAASGNELGTDVSASQTEAAAAEL